MKPNKAMFTSKCIFVSTLYVLEGKSGSVCIMSKHMNMINKIKISTDFSYGVRFVEDIDVI